ncbi:flavonol synthase [Croceicoccus estronivorus]|uniref:isopenicillin N synthase family dioxygenase n=1 Tax=Croceicoccus estronivorus TaxID=1172626 RepID=UPI00082FC402|nr:2-oxoglutarate and iron-dependent oxygenase domain-containing protein [Croceicoccus estronivorus]OCC24892.1 flavonol synthase [Croceicoccus estronivorus]
MTLQSLPILSLADEPQAFARRLGESFECFGFAMVCDHGLDAKLVDRAWNLTRLFFHRTDEEKRRYHIPGGGGARGYTPFGTEVAKGENLGDLKEFWHIGRELPEGHPLLSPSMPVNIWPDRPEGFETTFKTLFSEMDRVGRIILSRIALHLQLPMNWFEPVADMGNSVLRLLHYPPVEADDRGAVRAAAHGDINLITLLLGAEESGLELLGRDGKWLAVEPPEGALVVNVGDMLERLTNNVLPSTIHRVRNPQGDAARRSRYAMPFFLHPRSDFTIATLAQCIDARNPNRYREPITADAFLQQRLQEIGLKG